MNIDERQQLEACVLYFDLEIERTRSAADRQHLESCKQKVVEELNEN